MKFIMRKKVHKIFFVWSFDREEKWLNEMASKGLALVSVGFCTYYFEETAFDEYGIRLELLENVPACVQSEQYIKFVEETGAEYIGSVMRWVYFRKKKNNGEFDLFSDFDSRLKHLNRMLALLTVICLLQIGGTVLMTCNAFHSISGSTLVDFIFASFFLIFALVIGYGIVKTLLKKRKLKKEKQLFE